MRILDGFYPHYEFEYFQGTDKYKSECIRLNQLLAAWEEEQMIFCQKFCRRKGYPIISIKDLLRYFPRYSRIIGDFSSDIVSIYYFPKHFRLETQKIEEDIQTILILKDLKETNRTDFSLLNREFHLKHPTWLEEEFKQMKAKQKADYTLSTLKTLRQELVDSMFVLREQNIPLSGEVEDELQNLEEEARIQVLLSK